MKKYKNKQYLIDQVKLGKSQRHIAKELNVGCATISRWFKKLNINLRTNEQRFWAKVNKKCNNKCWPWLACLYSNGYGLFSIDNKKFLAHRIAYKLYYKKDPRKLFVCHKCDNKLCCNPHHLFLGTNQDNMTDMINKDRSVKGENHRNSKLTENDVKFIRKYYIKGDKKFGQAALSKKFKVYKGTISNIINYKTWKHIKLMMNIL